MTQQARRTINQAHQEEQKHSAIQTDYQIESQPIFGIKPSFKEVRENQEHIKDNGLHSVEPHILTEIGVSHHNKIKGQKHKESIKREALENSYCRNQWLNNGLNRVELCDYILSVLYAIKERVKVAKC